MENFIYLSDTDFVSEQHLLEENIGFVKVTEKGRTSQGGTELQIKYAEGEIKGGEEERAQEVKEEREKRELSGA